ncbi:MAG: nucleotidyltransferase family protein [Candidatus Dormibacteraceae bacterium]
MPGVILFLSDLDLRLRGRTRAEPPGRHLALVSGQQLDLALDHLGRRPDCAALGILGDLRPRPPSPARLALLGSRRVLLASSDRQLLELYARSLREVGAEPECILGDHLGGDRVAAWALPVYALILAAGSGSRMGGDKLLLDLGGSPIVSHVVQAARRGGCDQVLVVFSQDGVAAAVAERAITVFNPDAQSGQASSLRSGLQAGPEIAAGALLMLGDQPLVGSETVRRLLQAWRLEDTAPALAASYDDPSVWLPPVLVARSLWPDLISLQGDAGARQYFSRHPELISALPVGGRAEDVDTPDDYARIVSLFEPGRPG